MEAGLYITGIADAKPYRRQSAMWIKYNIQC